MSEGEVDFVLQDVLSAQYWATEFPEFTTFGKSFIYGYGFGIAVNKSDSELLQQINNALLEFEKNGQFKKTYERYVPENYVENFSTIMSHLLVSGA
ncbi:transporter substrate-binding domain-containing protein [Legionella cincinnatiensis]|uniref:transporter substrate-binding domain-containing protein n=1 Tax=Legionella cincinnatiensis TaxID=28085 RepID=UPI0023790D3D|nr:transporter substrate-binding domain-containing protein [Legionella cincinnatiensis]